MHGIRRLAHYPLCWVGMHQAPPPRYPHGPIVADCKCCGRTTYFYGLSVYGVSTVPVLMPAMMRPLANLSA